MGETERYQTQTLPGVKDEDKGRISKSDSRPQAVSMPYRETVEAKRRKACETTARMELASRCEKEGLRREVARMEREIQQHQSQLARVGAELRKTRREAKSRESEMGQEVEKLKQALTRQQDESRTSSLELKNQLRAAKEDCNTMFKVHAHLLPAQSPPHVLVEWSTSWLDPPGQDQQVGGGGGERQNTDRRPLEAV